MNDTVGIVIVSHSKDIAKGTADMVRQMVGSEVKVAFCGGNPDGEADPARRLRPLSVGRRFGLRGAGAAFRSRARSGRPPGRRHCGGIALGSRT